MASSRKPLLRRIAAASQQQAVKKVEAVRQSVLAELDGATTPDVMSKAEALEVLEELSVDLDGRIECLKEEIANEEEEGNK